MEKENKKALNPIALYAQELTKMTGDQLFQQMKYMDQVLRDVQARIAALHKEGQSRADQLDEIDPL
jgi:hypothetical protein